jgi:hypothetical protein
MTNYIITKAFNFAVKESKNRMLFKELDIHIHNECSIVVNWEKTSSILTFSNNKWLFTTNKKQPVITDIEKFITEIFDTIEDIKFKRSRNKQCF